LLHPVKSFLRKLETCSYFRLLTYSDSGGFCWLDNLWHNDLRLHIQNISGTRCFLYFLWRFPVGSALCATSLSMLIRVFRISIATRSMGCTAWLPACALFICLKTFVAAIFSLGLVYSSCNFEGLAHVSR
jgi:hypothetical protein